MDQTYPVPLGDPVPPKKRGVVKREWDEAREAWREIAVWQKKQDKKKMLKMAFQARYIKWYILLVVLGVCIALLTYYRDTIVKFFAPHKAAIVDWPQSWSFPISWIFPVILMVIVSFPPLFGHEIILMVVGMLWGLWYGLAIGFAGTFIGEIACFYVFKYFLTDMAQKIEDENIMYACVAKLMKTGGLYIIVMVRFSIIPGHVCTAVQSTVGMSIWLYALAVIITCPKQLVLVYIGVLFGNKTEGSPDADANKSRETLITSSILAATVVMTIISAYVVYMRARVLYPDIRAERKARKAKALAQGNHDLDNVDDGDRDYDFDDPRHEFVRYGVGIKGAETDPPVEPNATPLLNYGGTGIYSDPFVDPRYRPDPEMGRSDVTLTDQYYKYDLEQNGQQQSAYGTPYQPPSSNQNDIHMQPLRAPEQLRGKYGDARRREDLPSNGFPEQYQGHGDPYYAGHEDSRFTPLPSSRH